MSSSPLDNPPARLLVVGYGNPLAGDDGAGVEFVRRLKARGDGGYELREMPHASLEFLDLFHDADIILFVDAVSSGAPPGTLHLLPMPLKDVEPRALCSISSHGWGLAEALELAQSLGRRVPCVMLLGVEIATTSPASHLSAPVERALGMALAQFPSLLCALHNPESLGQGGLHQGRPK